MQQIRGRVPDLMERNGLDESMPIYKYLLPLLEAEETIFTQFKGKFKDQRQVAALTVRLNALKEAFRLHGSYAPRDSKEAAQYGVKIIIADIPDPPGEFNQFIDVVPPKHHHGNVNPPEKRLEGDNGHKPDLRIDYIFLRSGAITIPPGMPAWSSERNIQRWQTNGAKR